MQKIYLSPNYELTKGDKQRERVITMHRACIFNAVMRLILNVHLYPQKSPQCLSWTIQETTSNIAR